MTKVALILLALSVGATAHAQVRLAADVNTDIAPRSPMQLLPAGDLVLYHAIDGAQERRLYLLDPKDGEPRVVTLDGEPFPHYLDPASFRLGDDTYVSTAPQGENTSPTFWRLAPADASLTRALTLDQPALETPVALAGALYYVHSTNPGGCTLNAYAPGTDATVAETFAQCPNSLTVFEDRLYFIVSNPEASFQKEIWSYDPATGETMQAFDPSQIETPVRINGPLAAQDGTLLFVGDLVTENFFDSLGNELWAVDEQNGARLIADIAPGVQSSSPEGFTSLNGGLYFSATDIGARNHLYVYRAQPDTVALVPDHTDASAFARGSFRTLGTSLYGTASIIAEPGVFKGSILQYDTETGDFSPLPLPTDDAFVSTGTGFVTTSDALAFVGSTRNERGLTSAFNVWVHVPETGRTAPVTDLDAGTESSNPAALGVHQGLLYFQAYTRSTGAALWTFDGATDSTRLIGPLVQEVSPSGDVIGGAPAHFASFDGTLFFAAGLLGRQEVWTYDAATETARETFDLVPGEAGSNPADLREINGALFFRAYDASGTTRALYTLTSAADSPTIVFDSVSVVDFDGLGGEVYAAGRSTSSTGSGIWRLDGASTSRVASFGDISEMAAHEGELYISGRTDSTGNELFAFSPATGTSRLVADFTPGTRSSIPKQLTTLDDRLYVVAAGSVWEIADGVPARRITDPEVVGSPESLTGADGLLYFWAEARNLVPNGTKILHVYRPQSRTLAVASPLPANRFRGTVSSIAAYDGSVFFGAFEPYLGAELYRYTNDTSTHIEADATADLSAPTMLRVYPNPARNGAQIVVSPTQTESIAVTLHDALGRQVARLHEGSVATGLTLPIDTSVLPSGVYFVHVQGESFAETQSLTVVR